MEPVQDGHDHETRGKEEPSEKGAHAPSAITDTSTANDSSSARRYIAATKSKPTAMRTDRPKSRPRRARSTASRIVTSRKRTLPDDASAYGRSGQDEVFGFVGDDFLSGGQGSDIVGRLTTPAMTS